MFGRKMRRRKMKGNAMTALRPISNPWSKSLAQLFAAFSVGILIVLMGFVSFANAQTVTIKNKWTETFLAGDAQGLSASQDPGAPNIVWMLQGVPGTNFFHIRTTDVGNFLHLDEAGDLRVGVVDPNDPGAHWQRQDGDGQNHRLQNVDMPDYYINNEQGPISASPIEPGWWSAMWNIQPAAQPRQAQTRQEQPAQAPPRQQDQPRQQAGQFPNQGQVQGQGQLQRQRATTLDWQQTIAGAVNAPPQGQTLVMPQTSQGADQGTEPQQGFVSPPPAGQQLGLQAGLAPNQGAGQVNPPPVGQAPPLVRPLEQPGQQATRQAPNLANGQQAIAPPRVDTQGRFGAQVQLVVRNFSGGNLDVFVQDAAGDQLLVQTIGPGQQLRQQTPVGYLWSIAQNDDWKGTYRISNAPVQNIQFPQR